MISKPRTALGGGLLAAVLLASGCQARVGSAATVGDDSISTKTLDGAFRVAKTSAGATAATKETAVLQVLVSHQELVTLAKQQHVTVPQGAVDARASQLRQEIAAGAAVLPPNTPVETQASTDAITDALGANNVALGGAVDYVRLTAIPVASQAVGAAVKAKLDAAPASAFALAQQYSTVSQLKQTGGDVGLQPTGQLTVVKDLKVGQSIVSAVGTSSTQLYVLRVNARLDLTKLGTEINALKVKINPRFGSWTLTTDPTTGAKNYAIVPAVSDVVTVGTTPAASVAPSAAPAASGAPAATAPASAPAATAAPASAAPSASAAPAPSATAAPAPTATASVAPSAAPSS
ncbi:hypothetical protein acdb102_06020 [Acidothermaceae bacterium B102]|nr:hypothetical protein acdb102_06020 [Acidothermaceae bacterium B102]